MVPSFVGWSCRDFFIRFKQALDKRFPILLVLNFLYPVYHGSLILVYGYTYVKVERADKVRKAGDEARDGVPRSSQ